MNENKFVVSITLWQGNYEHKHKQTQQTQYEMFAPSALKTCISNIVHTTRFWDDLYQVRQSQKITIPNNLRESKKTKGPKQHRQNRL